MPVIRRTIFSIIIVVSLIVVGLFFLASLVGVGCGSKKICNDFATYEVALKMFEFEQGHIPEKIEHLLGFEGGEYLDILPSDPWGNPYGYYISKGGKSKYVIVTYGEDGKVGGRDENRDIYSTNEYCQ